MTLKEYYDYHAKVIDGGQISLDPHMFPARMFAQDEFRVLDANGTAVKYIDGSEMLCEQFQQYQDYELLYRYVGGDEVYHHDLRPPMLAK